MGTFLQPNSQQAFARLHFGLRTRADLTWELLEGAVSSRKSLDNGIRSVRDGAVRSFSFDVGDVPFDATPTALPAGDVVVAALVHSKQTSALWYYVEGRFGGEALPTELVCACSAGKCVFRSSPSPYHALQHLPFSHTMANHLRSSSFCSHKEAFLISYYIAQHKLDTRPLWMPQWQAVKMDSFQANELPQMRWPWYVQQQMITNSPKVDEFASADRVAWSPTLERAFPAEHRNAGINVAALSRAMMNKPSAPGKMKVAAGKREAAAVMSAAPVKAPVAAPRQKVAVVAAVSPAKKARTMSVTAAWKMETERAAAAASRGKSSKMSKRVSTVPARLR